LHLLFIFNLPERVHYSGFNLVLAICFLICVESSVFHFFTLKPFLHLDDEGRTSSKDAAKLEQQLKDLKESYRREQDLMMSSFYEIGLRYQQLLSEYRFVLLETGRKDNLKEQG